MRNETPDGREGAGERNADLTLTRLRVRPYAHFAGGVDLRPQPLTMVVGRNAAGKTTLLRSIALAAGLLSATGGARTGAKGETKWGDLLWFRDFADMSGGAGTETGTGELQLRAELRNAGDGGEATVRPPGGLTVECVYRWKAETPEEISRELSHVEVKPAAGGRLTPAAAEEARVRVMLWAAGVTYFESDGMRTFNGGRHGDSLPEDGKGTAATDRALAEYARAGGRDGAGAGAPEAAMRLHGGVLPPEVCARERCSKAMRRAVNVVRTLLGPGGTGLLVIEEPETGLDARSTRRMAEALVAGAAAHPGRTTIVETNSETLMRTVHDAAGRSGASDLTDAWLVVRGGDGRACLSGEAA